MALMVIIMARLTKYRKDILDLLIKLDKIETENNWEYQFSCEYKNIKAAKRCTKIASILEKKTNQLWKKILTSCKVENQFKLPLEIMDYYENGRENNRYDKFNNYEKDMQKLGLKLPK